MRPSLPIIFISAACGIAASIFGFYLAYTMGHLSAQISAALATLSLLAALSGSAAWLSGLNESHDALANISFSCAFVVLVLLLFGGCALAGSLLASVLLTWR